MTLEEELKLKNEYLKKEYEERVKREKRMKQQERKVKVVKFFERLKRGAMAVILSPYNAVKSIQKYSTKKKLERESCLKAEKAWLLDRQEGRADLLSRYDKNKTGKRETQENIEKHDAHSQTIIHCENGPMLKTEKRYSFTHPNPYYGADEDTLETTYQGYLKIADKKGKEEIVYVETTCFSEMQWVSSRRQDWRNHKYTACYSKDGETFVELDAEQAQVMFKQFDKTYQVEYKNTTEISKDAETTK